MAAPATLDPSQYPLSIAGFTITGFADGSFIEISRDEDAFKDYSGGDGEAVRLRNKNRFGTVKITLMQSSKSNDILSALAAVDETGAAVAGISVGSGSFQCKDLNGRMVSSAESAWVKKQANVKLGDEHEPREWEIRVNPLLMFVGGNT